MVKKGCFSDEKKIDENIDFEYTIVEQVNLFSANNASNFIHLYVWSP